MRKFWQGLLFAGTLVGILTMTTGMASASTSPVVSPAPAGVFDCGTAVTGNASDVHNTACSRTTVTASRNGSAETDFFLHARFRVYSNKVIYLPFGWRYATLGKGGTLSVHAFTDKTVCSNGTDGSGYDQQNQDQIPYTIDPKYGTRGSRVISMYVGCNGYTTIEGYVRATEPSAYPLASVQLGYRAAYNQ